MSPTQLEGNKIIAEFDGYKCEPFSTISGAKEAFRKEGKIPLLAYELKYHSDWNSLIDACKRFDSIEVEYSILGEFQDMLNDVAISVMTYDIDTAFSNLVRAIKWYNDVVKKTKNE